MACGRRSRAILRRRWMVRGRRRAVHGRYGTALARRGARLGLAVRLNLLRPDRLRFGSRLRKRRPRRLRLRFRLRCGRAVGLRLLGMTHRLRPIVGSGTWSRMIRLLSSWFRTGLRQIGLSVRSIGFDLRPFGRRRSGVGTIGLAGARRRMRIWRGAIARLGIISARLGIISRYERRPRVHGQITNIGRRSRPHVWLGSNRMRGCRFSRTAVIH